MAVINGGLDAKYMVMKEDTGEQLRDGVDCFVIRSQDVFGAQALFAYANAVQSVLEVNDVMNGRLLSSEDVERLRVLADGAHELAVSWSRIMTKKIPD